MLFDYLHLVVGTWLILGCRNLSRFFARIENKLSDSVLLTARKYGRQ